MCKVFYKVNFLTVLLQLWDKGVPICLICMLSLGFRTQQFSVNWENVIPSLFDSNGLRQGGILFPHLFNVFIDGMNHELSTLPIEFMVNDMTFNNLCYVDDKVLISPTVNSQQHLIKTCCEFAKQT